VDCNDGNACTDDGCDAATGCVHANNAAPCDDGNACTTGDVCDEGECLPGAIGGFTGFECGLAKLDSLDICGAQLPKKLLRIIPKQRKRAAHSAARARALKEKGAPEKRIRKQFQKMQKALMAIERQVAKAEKTKKRKQHISPECAEMIRRAIKEPEVALASLRS